MEEQAILIHDRLIHDHNEISTLLKFFTEFLDLFVKGGVAEYVHKANKFCDRFIVSHFKWEEETLFPDLLKNCNDQEKELIDEIQKEHPPILKLVDTFKDLVNSYSVQPEEGQALKIVAANHKLVEAVHSHAKNEEIELFPIIEKYLK